MNKRIVQITRVTSIGLCVMVLIGCTAEPVTTPPRPQTQTSADAADYLYFVAKYDASRDPADDVLRAVEQATAENKRILLQVGGEWCGWCHRMSAFFHKNQATEELLRRNYLLVKVNYSDENQNPDFLGQYPDIEGYPHLFVLERDGTLLHSQDTARLEQGDSYNQHAMVDFLTKWAPPADL